LSSESAKERPPDNRPAGVSTSGYELNLGVQIRDTGWSDGIKKLRLGPDVPPVITFASLVSAGSRGDDAVVPKLIDAKQRWLDVYELVWDRGYSQLRPETTTHPLNQAGVGQTFHTMDWQRQRKTFDEHTVLVEGRLVACTRPRSSNRFSRCPRTDRPTTSAGSTRSHSTDWPATDSGATPGPMPTTRPGGSAPFTRGACGRGPSRHRCAAHVPHRS
jgi:hypothetical protein